MRSLDSAVAKLDRADAHLANLMREFDAYQALNPYEVIRQDDPVALKYRVSILDPPAAITADIGDYVHNLRSALDHTAYALARKPTFQTYFPIFEDRKKSLLKRYDPIKKRSRTRFNIMVSTMPRDAIKILRAIQPYQRGNAAKADILWAIHQLDIIDKHRHMAFLAPAQTIHLPPPISKTMLGRPLKDGEEMSFRPEAARYFPKEPKFYIPATLAVEFEEGWPDGILLLPKLHTLHDYVRNDVIPRFAGFFPQPK